MLLHVSGLGPPQHAKIDYCVFQSGHLCVISYLFSCLSHPASHDPQIEFCCVLHTAAVNNESLTEWECSNTKDIENLKNKA